MSDEFEKYADNYNPEKEMEEFSIKEKIEIMVQNKWACTQNEIIKLKKEVILLQACFTKTNQKLDKLENISNDLVEYAKNHNITLKVSHMQHIAQKIEKELKEKIKFLDIIFKDVEKNEKLAGVDDTSIKEVTDAAQERQKKYEDEPFLEINQKKKE